MLIAIVTSFVFGLFVGGFIGALSIVLVAMAKLNVEDMPETPIGVTREVPHLRW